MDQSAKCYSMSLHASETPGTHALFIEPGAQPHVNPNKRHITSQLWKRNDALAMKDGLHAPIKFVTGDAYLGEWRANKPHGQGTLTYRSGNKIEGVIPWRPCVRPNFPVSRFVLQASLPMAFHTASGRIGSRTKQKD